MPRPASSASISDDSVTFRDFQQLIETTYQCSGTARNGSGAARPPGRP